MKRIVKYIILIMIVLCVGITGYLLTKFQSVTIELGSDVNKEAFVKYGSTNNVEVNLDSVNINEVGEYDVNLKYFFINYQLKVKVVDTTSPILEVQNIYKPLDYEVNINDFIVNVDDKSEYSLSFIKDILVNGYGDYKVEISAKDIYDNETIKDCTLSIGWVKKEYSVEVGNTITRENLVFDKKEVNTIKQSDLDEINKKREGVYTLKSVKDGNEIIVTIEKTKDVTPPELVVKTVSIYEGNKVKSINDFISKATDKGSKVTTKMLTDIDYNKIGEQKIKIEATDEDGNKVVKEATLKIVKDTKGPKISGLSKITINKNTKIDYMKGVSSIDDNFGKCDISVDTSGVNISKYGTYYAVYTSSDKLGNKTTNKRVISVNHDKSDTDALAKKVADALSSDVEKIRDYVRTNVKYNSNSGGSDPVWQGLNNKIGNCIVHAYTFDALLKIKGYTTKIIWTTDKSHYWNMVYLNGKWVHMDSTPGTKHTKYSIMNDAQRYERLQGRDWDRSLWPKAE